MSETDLPMVDDEFELDLEDVSSFDEDVTENGSDPTIPEELNIMPLRDAVVFPMLIAPLSVGRPASIQLIDESVVSSQRIIGVVTQRSSGTDEPSFDDVYGIGCAIIVRTLMKGADGVRLIAQGISRFRIIEAVQTTPYLRAKVEVIAEAEVAEEDAEEVEALRRSAAALFDQAVRLAPNLPDDLAQLTASVSEPHVMADLITAHLPFSVTDKQGILEATDIKDRLRKLVDILGREVRVLELTTKVHSEVTAELSRTQRDYFLREQLKAIQRELGETDEVAEELEEMREKIEASGMPEEAMKASIKELDRLSRINPGSPEYTVSRTYVETMISIPWSQKTDDNLDLKHARIILDEQHYGLEKIKDRIIEFLAVRKVKTDGPVRQPILCFYGPPGVGKTSLGQSIADAMGRKFVRFSLGGMRDEAEIRGHRRTYIGALPGQIVQGLRRAETNNPVFVLDEIDKLGSDFRGDPASAMLEVLDPQQNNTFRDHYLDVPIDLSNVFFITTANRLDTIPAPLRDRMEIIELGGYTEEEKLEIAKRHLVPRQIEEHGLKPTKIQFDDRSLRSLISHYTREAGVRNLEREIGSVIRKATLQFAEGRRRKLSVTRSFVQSALGAPRYTSDPVTERKMIPGVAVGLAWTPVGGEILFIETTKFAGKGLTVTGQLGDVMKESVTAAMSYIQAHNKTLKIDPKSLEESHVHVHVPAGAVPKDGPSAGITMLTALVSLFTNRPVKERLAMTGEVTLTGEVLQIGGVKEKILAAYRAGVRTVILPKDNEKDYMEEVPEDIREHLTAHFVDSASQVLKLALQ
ncbi:endopeptidase La [Kamptonema cortianum]|nr:endopeptidase La [Geitlerinema splendidum]MDK3158806.1 endopeptidase La [Kamptonema cortianum]